MASVLVLYHSQEHGNTHAMAEAIADGVRDEAASDVRLVNTNEERLAISEYREADAAVFGSPDYYSYVAGGMKMFRDDWYIARQSDPAGLEGKPYALFYSHGGRGAVREPMEALFARMGTQIGDTVESKGNPNEETLAACRALGGELARNA